MVHAPGLSRSGKGGTEYMGGAWSSWNERRETVYAVVPFIRQAKDRACGRISSKYVDAHHGTIRKQVPH